MSFTNSSIVPVVLHKPHIVFIDGYWRVSPLHRPITPSKSALWTKAHSYVGTLNNYRLSLKYNNDYLGLF